MTLFELLILLLIAGLAGATAQALVGFSRGGCLASIAIGFIGALLGTWLARTLALPTILTLRVGGQAFPIVWSIVGAVIFVALVGLISHSSRQVV